MKIQVRWNSACAVRLLSGPVLCVILVLAGISAGHAQNTIYTIAGGASPAGPALGANADLAGPSSVAKDAKGNLYISDPSAQYVFKVDTSGNLTVLAGVGFPTEHAVNQNGKIATQSGVDEPNGIAVDKKGNVYFADTVNYMIRKVASNGLISNIAGNARLCASPTSACGDGGLAKQAQLNNPVGVATDATGNVYIADTDDNRVRVVNVGTTTITVAGVSIASLNIQTVAGTGAVCTNSLAGNCGDGGAATAAQLSSPQGIAVDALGNIYIADSGDRRIRVVSTTGVINAYAGSGNPCVPSQGCGDTGPALSANLSNPWQISLDAAGDLFIADPPENSIREVSVSTQTINTVAGSGFAGYMGDGAAATSAELNTTRGVTVDSTGNIFIADTGNQRIREFTVGGNITTYAGGGTGNDGFVATSAVLGAGRGVALDSAGNIYLADTFNNRIREIAPSNPPTSYGNISTIVGTGIEQFYANGRPGGQAELSLPAGVAVDSLNNVDIADTGNFVIRQYNPNNGLIFNIAGVPQQPCMASPCGDGGPALQATFGMPTSIALDSAGNIYVADAVANRIRVVNMGSSSITIAGVSIAPGAIQTVAGTGATCTRPAGPCGDNGPANAALLNTPFGVAVDSQGNIYIADTGDNRVREVVASTGKIVPYAFNGGPFVGPFNEPATKSQMSTPHYLTVDPHGNLYISGSDFYYVILRVDAVNHFIIPVAGVPTDPKFYGADGDSGPSTSAHLNNSGVVVDGAGHLYVADEGNNRIREILLTPTGMTSVSSLTYNPQTVGTTSAGQSFTLSNAGQDDLYISSNQVTGPFAVSSTTCSNNIVPPQASCTFTLTFTPTQTGPASGSIVINDNAYGSPSQTVTLSGTGQ